MIKATSNADIAGIRALTDEDIEATSGDGILSGIWIGIAGAVKAVGELISDAFGGPPAPSRGPFGNPQRPSTPLWPLRYLQMLAPGQAFAPDAGSPAYR